MKVFIIYYYISIIFIINIFHSYSLKFTIHQIHSNKNIRSLINENNNNNSNNFGHTPLSSSKEGLYTINLNIGNPNQHFNVLLDIVTPFLWVNNDNCKECKSENKFIPSSSSSFAKSSDIIKINYFSGEISGNICNDDIGFDFNHSLISKFNFILINETYLNYEFDGIFGLSKGVSDIKTLEYSTMYQIQRNKILEKNIFLLEFPKNNFYMGEIPSYLNEYNSYSCKNMKNNKFDSYYWNCIYENIKFNNNNQLIPTNSSINNYIIFNTGTNCLIFPTNYISKFKDIILSNKLLENNNCSIKINQDRNNLYELICNNNIDDENNEEYQNIYNNEEFISIYLNKEKKIFFKLNELYNKEDKNFKIYFMDTPNNAIILGTPFFEKYTILLDKDNNNIIIYDGIKKEDKKKILPIVISIIFIIIIVIFIILLIYKIIKRKRQISSNQIEKHFSSYSGVFVPEKE